MPFELALTEARIAALQREVVILQELLEVAAIHQQMAGNPIIRDNYLAALEASRARLHRWLIVEAE